MSCCFSDVRSRARPSRRWIHFIHLSAQAMVSTRRIMVPDGAIFLSEENDLRIGLLSLQSRDHLDRFLLSRPSSNASRDRSTETVGTIPLFSNTCQVR